MIDFFTEDLVLSIIILNIVNVLVLFFWDFPIIRKIKNGEFSKEEYSAKTVISLLKKDFFIFANSFAGIYILNAAKYAIDIYANDKIQAIFSYIMMPATVMILFTQFILLPFLNTFKELYENEKISQLNKLAFKIKLVVTLFGFCAVGVAYLIGPEFLSFIYGTNLLEYRLYLCIIIAIYIMYAISYINLTILTTLRKTFIQFVIYLISMFCAFIGSNLLVKHYGISGAVLSMTVTLTVQFVLYIIITKITVLKLSNKEE